MSQYQRFYGQCQSSEWCTNARHLRRSSSSRRSSSGSQLYRYCQLWVSNKKYDGKTDSKNETNNHSQLIILIIHSTHQHHPSIHPFIHHFFPSFLQQHIRCHLLQRFRQSQRRMLPRSIRSHYQLGIRRHCPILWHGLLCRWYLRNSLSLLLYRRSRKRNSRPSRRRRQWRINPRRRCPPTHE